MAFFRGWMSIDMNALKEFIASIRSLILWTQNCYAVSSPAKRKRFLPNPRVLGNRRVFNNDEDIPFHTNSFRYEI